MDYDAKKDAPEEAPEADVVTQIQDHIALICARFFNFIGALQRDAPPAPLHGEIIPDQRHEHMEVGFNCGENNFRLLSLLLSVSSADCFYSSSMQNEIKIMRAEVTESLTTLDSLIHALPDLSNTPEDKQWQEAAELEAACEDEAATLEKELHAAKEKLDSLYSAHGSLADASLPH